MNNRHLNRIDRQRLSIALWMSFGSILLSVVLSAGVALIGTMERERTAKIAVSTQNALCTFKRDLQVRAANTQLFVDQLSRGERAPIPGISIADLQRSLAAQKDTLESLADLICPDNRPLADTSQR